ncbi:MAG: thiamine pyrophosphate-dependent dehydrogenase E1 component subunit alpha [Verrucomicrobiota bacterium]
MALDPNQLRQAFRWMLLARALDDKTAALYRSGLVPGGAFLSKGQEALSVSLAMQLRPGDIYAPLIRDTAGRLAFGESIQDALRSCIGSPLGPMRGRDGNVHRGRPLDGYIPMISHLGAIPSVVNGALMARKLQGKPMGLGATCMGDGGTSTGAFHEAMNQAAVERLPLVMVIADNQYAYSTHRSRQFACDSLLDRAVGYGIDGHSVDGTDLAACLQTLDRAARRAREGCGPQMVVANLLRLCGHGEHDDASYVDPTLKAAHVGRDCVKAAAQWLLANQLASDADVAQWNTEILSALDKAVDEILHDPAPDPATEQWTALATAALRENAS